MAISFPSTLTNDSAKAGQLAAPKQYFGDGEFSDNRFAVAPVHTRFGALEWFVWDAELLDDNGLAEVVRQEPTLRQALKHFPCGLTAEELLGE